MNPTGEHIISIRNADIKGGDLPVLSGLDMTVDKGEFVYVVGKVGTGKTSLIRTLIAEYEPLSGSVEVCGYNIENIRKRDIPRLRRKIGVVFQDFQLLTDRSVHDNLEFVLRATGWKKKKEIDARITEVLTDVGMQTKDHRMPHQLSGGEQQRIAIARALLNKPELIIADEPTGNLDIETADTIMQLFRKIGSESGTSILMVTHNKDIFERYPGRAFLCEKGKCTERDANQVFDLNLVI